MGNNNPKQSLRKAQSVPDTKVSCQVEKSQLLNSVDNDKYILDQHVHRVDWNLLKTKKFNSSGIYSGTDDGLIIFKLFRLPNKPGF